ncbi:MAG: trypsin-like peptidase domain-containing protein [Acidimicrobiia bacterium]|nr:trypsin-like peptidase domain-containing protein [Acidimicrobiia bacterium]
MNSEFERSGDNDPTTPMFEMLLPQPTDEIPRPAREQPGGSNPPPPTAFSAPEPPPAPSPSPVAASPTTPLPTAAPPTPQPSPRPASPHPPQPRPAGGGPVAPNYAPPGTPVPPAPVEPPAPKSFTPSRPPEPPEGPGQKPGGQSRLSRWGWRSLVAFVAGGLIASAGFAAGEINDQVAAPNTATTPTSIVVRSESAGDLVEEPASLVAQVLGPSVVQIRTDFGLGSGVIYRDGYILTNNHVVEGAEILTVRLSTGETFDAELVGSDASKDLAVLSVGERDLSVADLALDTDVRVGQAAIAIGSPFDLQQTVTAGIVSAVNRPVPSRTPRVYVAMIQTDAPINPGNSGGALADRDGRVIGINTAIQTDGLSGTNAGVGFAIPIRDAVRIADLLVSGDPIEPGFLGVSGQAPKGGEPGVEIVDVTAGSAAAMAGIEVGDRVLSLDEAPVTTITELAGLVLARQAGDEVNLRVVRDGVELDVGAVLGARP